MSCNKNKQKQRKMNDFVAYNELNFVSCQINSSISYTRKYFLMFRKYNNYFSHANFLLISYVVVELFWLVL